MTQSQNRNPRNSDDGRAWANLGVALASTGDVDAAEEPFKTACRYEPENVKNWINLAKLHQAKGRGDLAKKAMAKAQALSAA